MTQQKSIRMRADLGFERTAPEGSGEGTESIRRGDEFDATPQELRAYYLNRQERPLATPLNMDDMGDVPVGGIPRSQVQEYLRGLSDEERTDLLAEFAPVGDASGAAADQPDSGDRKPEEQPAARQPSTARRRGS